MGTITQTVSLNLNAVSLFGVFVSVGFSKDHHGNMAFSFSYALPYDGETMYIGGLAASASVSGQVTSLDSVDDLTGTTGYVGVSGGYIGAFGIDAVASPNEEWNGVQVSAGGGAGADFHIMQTKTIQTKSFNPVKAIKNWWKSLFDGD